MNAPQKKPLLTTAAGTAIYPWLNTPDTEFDAGGVYHTKLRLEGQDALDMVARLTTVLNAAKADALAKSKTGKIKEASLPWVINELDGTVEFKFKLKASGKNNTTGEEFTQKPKLFDLAKEEFTGIVTNNSTIKVAFEPVPFANASLGVGMTLRLKAVQVVKVAPMQSRVKNAFGDDTEQTAAASEDDAYNF